MTFNWQQFYNPRDLDISAILKDYVDIDQLIDTLDLPEYQELAAPEDDILDTIVVEVPAAPEPATAPGAKSLGQETHLPTPSATPTPEQPALPEQPVLPSAAGNIAPQRNQVYANLDKSNIIPGSRTRHGAHAVAISQSSDLLGYYLAFSTAVKAETTKPPHRSTLPKPPKS
jgi:hypothetical protein